MKFILTFCTILLCITANSQSWFDSSCKNINDKVNEEEFKISNDRNILNIIINQAGEIEINDEVKSGLSEIAFKELVLNFVTNPDGDKNKADKPEKVFIQLKSLNKDDEKLKTLKSYLQDVYLYLWDKASDEKYKSTYIDLTCKKRDKIFQSYPFRLLSDDSKKMKRDNKLRRGPGLPAFGGDVKKN